MQTYCGGGKVRVRGDLVGGHWHQKEEDHLFGEIIIPGVCRFILIPSVSVPPEPFADILSPTSSPT